MARYELTDFEWQIIQPLLPNKPRGVPRVDDRRVMCVSASKRGSDAHLRVSELAGADDAGLE